DAAFISNSSLSYDFLAAVSENINCAPSLLLLFRALEYRRDKMHFEVAKAFLSLSERNQQVTDMKQDVSFCVGGVPFWRRNLFRWIYEMIEEEKTIHAIIDAVTAASTSRQVPSKDLLLQQCKSILLDDFGPERIISDDLVACAACYLLIRESQFISEYKGRLFVPSLISQLLNLSTEKPNFTKSACSLCSNFLQPWLKSIWDKSLLYFPNISFSPPIGMSCPQSVSNMGFLTFTIKLLSFSNFVEGHAVLDSLINCLTTFLKNARKIEPTVDYNTTKALKKKPFLQEVAEILQIALTCVLESDRNNAKYLMNQVHLQSRIQSNNPRLLMSLILQAAATESNYFSQRVSPSLFTPQTLEVLIFGCQSMGYFGEAVVLCQFEGRIHIPIGLRILESAVKASSTFNAYDSLESMTVFLWDLQLLEALCKFQQCNQAFSRKNSFLRCINQLEVNAANAKKSHKMAIWKRQREFLRYLSLKLFSNRCSFSEAAFKRRGPGATIRTDLCMNGIDYSAECNIIHLPMLVIQNNFFDFGDYVLLWDGDFSHYDNSAYYIVQLMSDISHCDGSTGAILNIFRQLRGAFAFILIQKFNNRIYFGRDKVGQRSLIDGLVEIPASGIYVATAIPSGGFCIESCHFWSDSHKQFWIDHSFNQGIKYDVLCHPLKLICDHNDPISTMKTLLQQAIAKQVGPLSQLSIQLSDFYSCPPAQIGVLFSGGLDSTVIAALTDRVLTLVIEIMCCTFSKNNNSTSDQLYASPDDAPDRQTALSSFEDLRRRNPNRHWHLILADVTIRELKNARRDRVRALLKPAPETVLNDSLSIAFWFAARGKGRLICSRKICNESRGEYTSSAKVILTGTGADEQLAGYSRHRKIFERHGAEALQSELSLEMLGISERNLGRDDRIVSDHGRQAAHPFLDEDVTDYLASLSLEKKVDLNLPRGEGEKLLLRNVAASLDLLIASRLPKRAFQFGSRMAKTESLHKVTGADSVPLDVD
ncbi:unnamed protein product, partial [Rodentolepis nana]|uniref:Asparagine synthetase domain-containing protein n=1 Tax=Rodentolepis nana TaxID=102285 RepID=A0A0R3TT93_RODNA